MNEEHGRHRRYDTTAMILSACGGDATSTTVAPTPTPTVAPDVSPPVAPDATPTVAPDATPTVVPDPTATLAPGAPTPTATLTPATPTPSVPQELRINLGGEPTSLDPQRIAFATDLSVVRQLFRGLLGFTEDLTLEPVVATQVPSVENGGISADGLTYTFTLRDDVTWSDGAPLTARDFEFAIKRLLDPRTASQFFPLYLVIQGAVPFATAFGADPDTLDTLRDGVAVEAQDDRTLRVTLAAPNPTFLHKMARALVYPVRHDVIEQFGDQWTEAGNHIGNGPFVLTEWAHQDHITLEPNPNYVGPQPHLSKITFAMIPDPGAELNAYRNDELDLSRVPPGTEGATMSDATLGAQVQRSVKLSTVGLFFNNTVEPFNDVNVRRAFATAIDRQSWVDRVKNGVGVPATGWLPPGDAGLRPPGGPAVYPGPRPRSAASGRRGLP